MNTFIKYRSIILACIVGILREISFFSSIFTILVHNNTPNPALVGFVISCRKIGRFIFDVPSGYLANKIGIKTIFSLSTLAMCFLSVLTIFCPLTIIALIIVALLEGLSKAGYSGKVEGFIYSVLSRQDKGKKFSKIVSLYYFFMDMSIGFVAIVASKLYTGNYKLVFLYTLIISVISLVLLAFMDKKDIFLTRSRHLTVKETITSLSNLAKQSSLFLNIILFWGIISFIGRQTATMLSLVLIENNYVASDVVKIQGILSIMLASGCVISFAMANSLSLVKLHATFLILTTSMVLSSSFHLVKMIIFCTMAYQILFATLEVAMEKIIDSMVPKKIRITINSLITTVASIFNIVGTIIFGYIAKYSNYNTGWLVIISSILVFGAITLIKSFKWQKELKQITHHL